VSHRARARAPRLVGLVGLVGLLGALAVACGPVTYINEVTRQASADVEAASAAQADRYAPYHYTLAVAYLRKAREEAAQADYQAANRLGRKASQAARTAIEVSLSRVRRADEPATGAAGAAGSGDRP
jgi:hypothetical protein